MDTLHNHHGHTPQLPRIHSTVTTDTLHSHHGYTPQSPRTHSTVTMDTLHNHHRHTPQSPRIHSTVTTNTLHSHHGYTPQSPQTHIELPRIHSSHHGHTPQLPRIHSTESYPVYLSEILTVYHPSRQLRSISDTRTFRKPFTKTKTFGQRAFSFTGPTEWNSLQCDVRH